MVGPKRVVNGHRDIPSRAESRHPALCAGPSREPRQDGWAAYDRPGGVRIGGILTQRHMHSVTVRWQFRG